MITNCKQYISITLRNIEKKKRKDKGFGRDVYKRQNKGRLMLSPALAVFVPSCPILNDISFSFISAALIV